MDNIKIQLSLPAEMVADLQQMATNHGRRIQDDIRIRLARSLERENEANQHHKMLMSALWDAHNIPKFFVGEAHKKLFKH